MRFRTTNKLARYTLHNQTGFHQEPVQPGNFDMTIVLGLRLCQPHSLCTRHPHRSRAQLDIAYSQLDQHTHRRVWQCHMFDPQDKRSLARILFVG